MARQLTAREAGSQGNGDDTTDFTDLGSGKARYVELDAEEMADHPDILKPDSFDCVWISECMSHLQDKESFFRNASALLRPGGKLVIADW